MAKIHYKARFNDSWLVENDLKGWIKKVPDDTNYFCQWCKFTGSLSITGKQAIFKHIKSKRHQMANRKKKVEI